MRRGQYKKLFWYFSLRMINLVSQKRIFVILAIIYIILWEYTKGVRGMIRLVGVFVSPYFFNFLMSGYLISSGVLKILILVGYLLIVCDVSQKQKVYYYCAVRTGKRVGLMGDLLLVGCVAFLYTLCIWLFSILVFLPFVSFEKGWGKIIGTLAYTDAGVLYAPDIIIPKEMVELYQPADATLLSALLMFLGCFFLGAIIYLVNIVFKVKTLGPGVAGFLIFWSPIVTYMRKPEFHWASPVSWMSLSELKPVCGEAYPSVYYGIGMLALLLFIIVCCLFAYAKNMEMGRNMDECL